MSGTVLRAEPGAGLAVLARGGPGAHRARKSSQDSAQRQRPHGQTAECLPWAPCVKLGLGRPEWSFQEKLDISQFLNIGQKTFFTYSSKPSSISVGRKMPVNLAG